MKVLLFFSWFLRGCLVLVLIAFGLKNTDAVTLHFFLGKSWEMPLIALLLLFMVIGVALTLLAWLGVYLRVRKEIQALKRQLRAFAVPPPGVPPEPVAPPPADAAG